MTRHTQSMSNMNLIWMGLLTGVFFIAAAMYLLPYDSSGAFPGGQLWWLAILLPVAPVLILRQRLRSLEQAWRGDPAKTQALRTAYMLCWSVADMAVMLGAPLGMISGQKELIIGGLLVSVGLLLLCRPDASRHI